MQSSWMIETLFAYEMHPKDARGIQMMKYGTSFVYLSDT